MSNSTAPLFTSDEVESIFYLSIQCAVEFSFYGVHATLYFVAAYLLIAKGLRLTARKVLLAITTIMFAASTVFTSLDVVLDGMILSTLGPDVRPPPNSVYLVFNTMPSIIYFLSDLIVIWRTWVIWPGNWWARGVLGMCIAGSLFSCISVAIVRNLLFLNGGEFTTAWRVSPLVVLLGINLATTCLVGVRLWLYRKDVAKLLRENNMTSSVQSTLVVLVESGSIYCILWLVMSISGIGNLVDVQDGSVMIAASVSIAGIYPTFIIIMVAIEKSHANIVFSGAFSHSIKFAPGVSSVEQQTRGEKGDV